MWAAKLPEVKRQARRQSHPATSDKAVYRSHVRVGAGMVALHPSKHHKGHRMFAQQFNALIVQVSTDNQEAINLATTDVLEITLGFILLGCMAGDK